MQNIPTYKRGARGLVLLAVASLAFIAAPPNAVAAPEQGGSASVGLEEEDSSHEGGGDPTGEPEGTSDTEGETEGEQGTPAPPAEGASDEVEGPEPTDEAADDEDGVQGEDEAELDEKEEINPAPFPTKPLARGFTRLGGANRYGTSVAVSKRIFPQGKQAQEVFIASGTAFPDGISMGALAASRGGPLLLTQKDSLPPEVRNEIVRLKPKRIYIAGGSGAVSNAVENQLEGLTGEVVRLGGKDRYGTSSLIAAEFGSVDSVMLATGRTFPDALVASSVLNKVKGAKAPVLLTPGFQLGQESKETLAKLKPSHVYIVGGKWTAASKSEIKKLSGGAEVSLHAGKDRYATSASVVKHFYGANFSRFVFATGVIFPDAMSGGPLAKAVDAPIVLTRKDCRPAAITSVTGKQSAVAILGGTGALKQTAVTTKCPVLPPKVSQSGGYYRFGMKWQAQQTRAWCGPATGAMVLARVGPTTSASGVRLSQKALASSQYMRTTSSFGTEYVNLYGGLNRWTGKATYSPLRAPSAAQFRDKVNQAFTKTGRPIIVDTQEWAWGPHYNGHPRKTMGHYLPVEGYNPSTDTVMILDSASEIYKDTGCKPQFTYNLASFTQFLQSHGIFY